MPKPKLTDELRQQALIETQALIREIKDNSGLSSEMLSRALQDTKPGLSISGDLLRQYLTGKKHASALRRFAIARAACKLEWGGSECKRTVSRHPGLYEPAYEGILKADQRASEKCWNKIRPALATLLYLHEFDVKGLEALISSELWSLVPEEFVEQAKLMSRLL